MRFEIIRDKLAEQFARMCGDLGNGNLYTTAAGKDEMWDHYLNSFPEGTNPIYRVRREYDCSCCRNFIRQFGNVVSIKDGVVHSIWDFDIHDNRYQPVFDAMSSYVKSFPVCDYYYTKETKYGCPENREIKDSKVNTYVHFYVKVPREFSCYSYNDKIAEHRDTRNVFKRSLDELTLDSIDTVLDLISQGALYRGNEFKETISYFRDYKKVYDSLASESEKELYAWEHSNGRNVSVYRIRNTAIGTLLIDISEGVDLDTAVTKYEHVVAPGNYKRPKEIFTQKMLDDAKKQMEELGYLGSLNRRAATLDDINVNNVLFANKDAGRTKACLDIFDEMSAGLPVNPKKFSRVTEITAEKFVNDVLPRATSVEALVEGRHQRNLVSLVAPGNLATPSMFKWDNGFSWAYSGNLADSDIKQNVAKAGGKTSGCLRFSIQWNELGSYNPDDLDAHCTEPNKNEIDFRAKRSRFSDGELDVDIINPQKGVPAVENIIFTDQAKMKPGDYLFRVHKFSDRGGSDGFRAEIEFDGHITRWDYQGTHQGGTYIDVAVVTLDKNGNFTMKELIPSVDNVISTREIWGVHTNQFVPVSAICYSPNYWDDNAIGNRHYFFFLKGCHCDETPNGFYNEFLKPELLEHKRVLAALGSRMKVAESENSLCGLGFSDTQRNELIVKVTGATETVLKVLF